MQGFLNRRTIGRLLASALGLVLAAVAMTAFVANSALNDITAGALEQNREVSQSVVLLLNADRDAYQAQIAFERALIEADADARGELVAAFEENYAQVGERFAAYRELAIGAEGEAELAAPFAEHYAAWGDATATLLAADTPDTQPGTAAITRTADFLESARGDLDALQEQVYRPAIETGEAHILSVSSDR